MLRLLWIVKNSNKSIIKQPNPDFLLKAQTPGSKYPSWNKLYEDLVCGEGSELEKIERKKTTSTKVDNLGSLMMNTLLEDVKDYYGQARLSWRKPVYVVAKKIYCTKSIKFLSALFWSHSDGMYRSFFLLNFQFQYILLTQTQSATHSCCFL